MLCSNARTVYLGQMTGQMGCEEHEKLVKEKTDNRSPERWGSNV